jgi:hypothetical protein
MNARRLRAMKKNVPRMRNVGESTIFVKLAIVNADAASNEDFENTCDHEQVPSRNESCCRYIV